ncbi:hypothetical protein OSB04_023519 [Centaurea solstitialis]|uniref:Uncharacterized protein n=1 Tax=Centaurea solstitialis TaxID=347529 RepID=A0AA38W2C6_9ASTR|nr:hypothetical protein OSB04_023519 [Centaurea solstitialis]
MRERARESNSRWERSPAPSSENVRERVRGFISEKQGREPGHRNRNWYRGFSQNRSALGTRLAKETSLLFFNFPEDWDVTNLWRLFKRYGTVSDIYMAFKRLRNGERFGFVRYRGVQNEIMLERNLKQIWVGSRNLKVFLADKKGRGFDNRPTDVYSRHVVGKIPIRRTHVGNRSYADVVKSEKEVDENVKIHNSNRDDSDQSDLKGPNLGSWEAEAGDLDYLSRCAVGSVERMEHVDSIQALISAGTLDNCEIKMLGGSEILLKFDSIEYAKNIIRNKVHGLHFWAKDLSLWTKGFRASKRLVWLRIVGVPLHIWKVEVFKDIARNWGTVVTTSNCDLKTSPNLMWGKVLINTSLKSTINEIKSVKVGGLFYVVKVEEEDGVGLEGQIRSYHQQVQELSDEDKEYSSINSEWSEEEEVNGDEDSVKGSYANLQQGNEEDQIKGRWSNKSDRENPIGLAPHSGCSSHAHSVSGEGDGSRLPDLEKVAGENLEAEKSAIPPIGENLEGTKFSEDMDNYIDGEPKGSLPASDTVDKDLQPGEINRDNPVTKSNRRVGTSQSKGKSMSGGAQRSKGSQVDNIGFGRGRASLHVFKKLARAKAKKSNKGRQTKGNLSMSGDLNSSESGIAISSEIKGEGLEERLEEFGSDIGVIWPTDVGQKEKKLPCFFGIQETKLKEVPSQLVFSMWGLVDADYDFVEATGNSGGLLSIWNKSIFQGQFVIKDRFFLAVVGKWENKDGLVGFVNVYGPNEQSERAELWSKLDQLCLKEEVSWCFFGDFNEVRNIQERLNSVASKRGMNNFNDFIRRNALEEVALGGSKFTRISDDGTKFSKLDRFLVSRSFGERWRNLNALTLERTWSDHYPILLRDKVKDFGLPPFKFYDTWLKEEAVAVLVKRVWQESTNSSRPDCIFREKLKKLKLAIKEWIPSGWGVLDKKVIEARDEVKKWESKGDVSFLEGPDRENWLEARKKWRELEEKNSAIARQRAKLKWAKDGDENSKLFHTACKLRERRNRIHGLNIHGSWSENPDEIKRYVFNFFKQKYTSHIHGEAKLKGDRFKKISVEEAKELEGKFSEEEVWKALKDCGCNKSPGPDGFTTGFFKKFWDIIKKDLLAVLDWFWEKEALSNGCNSSFITLIPKSSNPIGLNDFRPISLVGVVYKVISKVLAERMKVVMERIISDVQSAFLKGRSILDGVLVANETVSYIKGSKRKALIFKVDFEKAYDSVNWNFLLDVLKSMGFGVKWCNWIRACLRSSRISVLVNGSPTEEFTMEKGIRQGDPLAPFLFLVVAEGLHIMVEEAKEKGLYKGLKVGNKEVVLSHLQYADDAIFFGEWEAENIVNVVKILKCFHAVSVSNAGCNFSGSFEKEVGDGRCTKFWEDRWAGGEVLKDRFTRLFNLETCKGVLIADRGRFHNSGWVWEWCWRREPRGRELSEFSEFCRILDRFKPKLGGVDKFVWKLDSVVGFSVKTLRAVLREARAGGREVGRVLDKRGIDMDSILCPRCNRDVETVSHALFSCEKVKALWQLVGNWWKLDVSNAGSLQDILLAAVRNGANSKGTARWEATIRCMTYLVWSNRNNLIFNSGKGDLVDKLVEFQRRIFEWLSNRNREMCVDWFSWLSDPVNL